VAGKVLLDVMRPYLRVAEASLINRRECIAVKHRIDYTSTVSQAAGWPPLRLKRSRLLRLLRDKLVPNPARYCDLQPEHYC